MLCYAMLCYAVLYYNVLYSAHTLLYYNPIYSTLPYFTTLSYLIRFYREVPTLIMSLASTEMPNMTHWGAAAVFPQLTANAAPKFATLLKEANT